MTDRISIGQAGLNGRPHALYRFFDRSDVLLYVGITVDIGARFKKHRGEKPWWDQVDHIGIEHFATRKEAEAAEKKAIQEKQPLHNVIHNEFVETGGTDGRTALAVRILHMVVDAPPGSGRYASTLREITEESSDPDRAGKSDEEVVCEYLLEDMRSQLTALKRGLRWIVNALPTEVVERYQQREIDDWRREGLDEFGDPPFESLEEAVLTGLATDIAWQGLTEASPDEREHFLAFARERTRGRPSSDRIQVEAVNYMRAHLHGDLDELIRIEDEARREEDEAPF